jgi:hypothetical protein
MYWIKNVCFQKRSKRLRGFPPAGKNMLHRLQVISIGLKVAIKTTQAVQIVTTIESHLENVWFQEIGHSYMIGTVQKLCEIRCSP